MVDESIEDKQSWNASSLHLMIGGAICVLDVSNERLECSMVKWLYKISDHGFDSCSGHIHSHKLSQYNGYSTNLCMRTCSLRPRPDFS